MRSALIETRKEQRSRLESPEHLQSVLDYDPATGLFVWKIREVLGRYAGTKTAPHRRNGYPGFLKITIERFDFKAHRLAWIMNHGAIVEPGAHIDHINGDSFDNRLSNLRLCSARENARNSKTPKNNTSGFKGVSHGKREGMFRAYICVDRHQRHLGYFDTPELASAAYCAAAVKYFGEFACLDR